MLKVSKLGKVLVILIEYENGYNIPDFQKTNSRLGFKLDTFDDSIVKAAKKFAIIKKIAKVDYTVWSRYDPEGLNYRLKTQETEQTNSADPKGRAAD